MRYYRLFCALFLTVILSVSAAIAPARAQSATTLSVTPAASQVLLNNTTTIRLFVTGGVEVNAFDVAIAYDSQGLTLESWAYGDYLSGLARVYLVNQPGQFRVAATQLARPGVTGDGTLLTFVFRGVAEGPVEIAITYAAFSSPKGVSTIPQTMNGTLTVVLPADPATPTATQTATATATVTATATATATTTATATATATATITTTVTVTLTASPTSTLTTVTPTAPVGSSNAAAGPTAALMVPSATVPPQAAAAVPGSPLEPPGVPAGTEIAQMPAEDLQGVSAVQPAAGQKRMWLDAVTAEKLEKILAAILILLVVALILMLAVLTRRHPTRQR